MMKEMTITKRQMFEAMINFANGEALSFIDPKTEVEIEITDAQLKAFAEHEIALLDKKAAKAKETAAKKQKEDPLYDTVKYALTDEFRTIADITEDLVAAGYADATVAKVTYRLNKLVEAGDAEKTDVKVEKRTVKAYKATFVVAE